MQERLTKFAAVLSSSDSSICTDLCNKNCSDGHSKMPKRLKQTLEWKMFLLKPFKTLIYFY